MEIYVSSHRQKQTWQLFEKWQKTVYYCTFFILLVCLIIIKCFFSSFFLRLLFNKQTAINRKINILLMLVETKL